MSPATTTLASACHAHERLSFTEGPTDADEPALWQKDMSGGLELRIDLGQPEVKGGYNDQLTLFRSQTPVSSKSRAATNSARRSLTLVTLLPNARRGTPATRAVTTT